MTKKIEELCKEKMNQLEKVMSFTGLLDYMYTNHSKDVNELIDKYNDISISVQVRRKNLNKKGRDLEALDIMKGYLKDETKEIHVLVNDYYKQEK